MGPTKRRQQQQQQHENTSKIFLVEVDTLGDFMDVGVDLILQVLVIARHHQQQVMQQADVALFSNTKHTHINRRPENGKRKKRNSRAGKAANQQIDMVGSVFASAQVGEDGLRHVLVLSRHHTDALRVVARVVPPTHTHEPVAAQFQSNPAHARTHTRNKANEEKRESPSHIKREGGERKGREEGRKEERRRKAIQSKTAVPHERGGAVTVTFPDAVEDGYVRVGGLRVHLDVRQH